MTRKERITKTTDIASLTKGKSKQANLIFFAIESDRGLLLGKTGAGITNSKPGENGVFYWDDKNLN